MENQEINNDNKQVNGQIAEIATKASAAISQGKIDTAGRLFGLAWRVYKENLGVFLGISSLPIIVTTLITLFYRADYVPSFFLAFILWLVGVCVALLASLALICKVVKTGQGGQSMNVGQTYSAGMSLFFPTFGLLSYSIL